MYTAKPINNRSFIWQQSRSATQFIRSCCLFLGIQALQGVKFIRVAVRYALLLVGDSAVSAWAVQWTHCIGDIGLYSSHCQMLLRFSITKQHRAIIHVGRIKVNCEWFLVSRWKQDPDIMVGRVNPWMISPSFIGIFLFRGFIGFVQWREEKQTKRNTESEFRHKFVHDSIPATDCRHFLFDLFIG